MGGAGQVVALESRARKESAQQGSSPFEALDGKDRGATARPTEWAQDGRGYKAHKAP